MKLKQIRDDTRGNALVEFTVTFPLFLLLMFGIVQAGLLLYSKHGLQHGVEVAARCASVNYSANKLGLGTSCFTVSGTAVAPSAVTNTTIQQYAAQHSWGSVPSSSSFIVDCPNSVTPSCNSNTFKCGTDPGYQVSVTTATINLIGFFSTTLIAKSCFPINVS